jgi:hypothetical protein
VDADADAGLADGEVGIGADADVADADCGPRRGSRVERLTNSGVIAILGIPLC